MRKFCQLKAALVTLVALLLAGLSLASPALAVDTFPGTTISGTGSLTGTTVGATGEPGEYVGSTTTFPPGGGAPLNSIWYSWTAPSSGVVSFGTCNPTGSSLTNYDSTIVVATGNAVNALTVIAQNDDTPGCNSVVNSNYGSTVTFNAVGGTTYRIQIDGYTNAVGTYQLFYGFSGYKTVASTTAAVEAGATSSFTVELTAVPSGPATITIGTSPQCTFSPSTLNFTSANWNVPQTVTVTAIDDTAIEGSHFCAPNSITPSGGGVAASSAPPPTFTVTDNDTGVVSIANTTNGAEAGPANGLFTITQVGTLAVNNTITYTVSGTATSGADYTALSGTVTILAGQTTATISVPVIDDPTTEPNETVIVTMTADTSALTTFGTASATSTITSNDVSTASIALTTNGNEAGAVAAVFTVTLTNASSTNSVFNLARSGTAATPADYTNSPGATVTVTAGSTTATLTYPVIDDAAVEGDETLTVTLSGVNSGLATLGSPTAATATIFDNDSPTVTIANAIQGAEAGPTNGTMTVTLSQTRPAAVTVAYTVSGTATSGTDYTALSGSITIPANTLTATLTIPVLNDAIVETGETVIVTLTSVTSGSATIGAIVTATNTIADNDSATVSIANTTNGAETGPANGVMTLTQTVVSAVNTVVSYTISGTATSGTDYTALSGTVTIPAGVTSALVTIPVIDDLVIDPGETVIVTLTAVTSGQSTTLAGPVAATNTIADNDIASLSLAKNWSFAAPGNDANGNGTADPGDIVSYSFVVVNTGTLPVANVVINETAFSGANGTPVALNEQVINDVAPLNDSTDAAPNDGTWTSLAPGDTIRYRATYTVVQADIDNQ